MSEAHEYKPGDRVRVDVEVVKVVSDALIHIRYRTAPGSEWWEQLISPAQLHPAPDAATETVDVLTRLGFYDGAIVSFGHCEVCDDRALQMCRIKSLRWQCLQCRKEEAADAAAKETPDD